MGQIPPQIPPPQSTHPSPLPLRRYRESKNVILICKTTLFAFEISSSCHHYIISTIMMHMNYNHSLSSYTMTTLESALLVSSWHLTLSLSLKPAIPSPTQSTKSSFSCWSLWSQIGEPGQWGFGGLHVSPRLTSLPPLGTVTGGGGDPSSSHPPLSTLSSPVSRTTSAFSLLLSTISSPSSSSCICNWRMRRGLSFKSTGLLLRFLLLLPHQQLWLFTNVAPPPFRAANHLTHRAWKVEGRRSVWTTSEPEREQWNIWVSRPLTASGCPPPSPLTQCSEAWYLEFFRR